MRDWESALSWAVFSLAAVVMVYSLIQIVAFPFRFRMDAGTVDLDDLSGFKQFQLEAIETYQKDFATHALFSKAKEAPVIVGPSIAELVGQYALIGVVQGIESEAIIQHKSTKQTYFVQIGERFDRFTVVRFKPHGIVVECEGNEIELQIEEGIR